MGYTTYEFYKSNFFGETIPETEFKKWDSRAKTKLDYLTMNKITKELLEDEDINNKVQMAECVVMDLLYRFGNAEKQQGIKENGEGKIIKSKSAGSESISYDVGNDVYTKALTDPIAQKKLMREGIAEHLHETGLMNCGVW